MISKTNLIFILADDMGAWALGAAGNKDVETPNLDRLAASGLRFDNFFCCSPVCSPARASILTGKIPSQHGVHDWIRSGNLDREEVDRQLGNEVSNTLYLNEKKAITYLEEQTSYTDLLHKSGYQCALSGKWHLGDSLRKQHGFDYWYTIARGGAPIKNRR